MSKDVLADIRNQVRALKTENKLSDSKLADRLGTTPWTYYSLMQGGDIKASSLIKIMQALEYKL